MEIHFATNITSVTNSNYKLNIKILQKLSIFLLIHKYLMHNEYNIRTYISFYEKCEILIDLITLQLFHIVFRKFLSIYQHKSEQRTKALQIIYYVNPCVPL